MSIMDTLNGAAGLGPPDRRIARVVEEGSMR
jgi:hypothetical protein